MRSVTAVLTPAGGFHPHPISRALTAFTEETVFTDETVRQINILEDGTAVVLCEVRGDLNHARQLIDNHIHARQPIDNHVDVLSCNVFGEQEGNGLVYTHIRPSESSREIIETIQEHGVIFDYPFEAIQNDTVRVTLIGETNESLQRALTAFPDEIDITVERIGAYPSKRRDLSSVLTERQQEILDIASDLGYYEVPRQATHADIAERAGLNPGTVSEHMQRIEARVFAELFDR